MVGWEWEWDLKEVVKAAEWKVVGCTAVLEESQEILPTTVTSVLQLKHSSNLEKGKRFVRPSRMFSLEMRWMQLPNAYPLGYVSEWNQAKFIDWLPRVGMLLSRWKYTKSESTQRRQPVRVGVDTAMEWVEWQVEDWEAWEVEDWEAWEVEDWEAWGWEWGCPAVMEWEAKAEWESVARAMAV
jgi:hypothetical protein